MYKIGFVGAGSMAEAILSGLVNGNKIKPNDMIITNHSNEERLKQLNETYGIHITTNKKQLMENSQIILLAMKPKDADKAIESISEYALESHLIISVLAGVSTKAIEQLFAKKIPVIRAMPNTSASIRQSATAIAKGEYATKEHLLQAAELFQAIGTVEVTEEHKLDAVTGLAGSGPAYIYYIVEAMERAALEIGLEKESARSLIVQTLYGAASMLQQSGKDPSKLREEVTSPGGTTEAGLSILKSERVDEAIIRCIKRASERSQELNKSLEEKLFTKSKY